MKCRDARKQLTEETEARRSGTLQRHLANCAACTRYLERLETARDLLRGHHARLAPDPAFATRLAARLETGPALQLGGLAAKLLPATLALVAVLFWFAWSAPSPLDADWAQAPTEDPLGWLLETNGQGS